MPESNEKLLQTASILRLEPGDRIIVKSERRIPRSAFLRLKSQLQERFPDNDVVVLEAGVSLEVLRNV